MKTKAKTKPARKRRIYKAGGRPAKGVDPSGAYGGAFRVSTSASKRNTPTDIGRGTEFAPDGSPMPDSKFVGWDRKADFLASAASLGFSGDPGVAGQEDDPGTTHEGIGIPTGAGKTLSWSNGIVVDEAHQSHHRRQMVKVVVRP